ncbi:hypothetical protein BUALT_Bualt11G0023500 [Buddleja alternifolia]|uniref:GPI ethanolamine phosphate transferase 2 n=1 Tax=Buddleja alternifolia TaxID=168488 RepID=A0AAV6WWW0_9LAMI|nr:hypothetical protein BUALT_Bualt11G0023500 [Buddleja alternifolia]
MSKNHSLTCAKLTLFTVSAVMIQIIGLFLFIMGFFPVKPTLSGISGLESFYPPDSDSTDYAQNTSTLPPEKLKSLYQELSGVPPLFDRLILMVIDGLPAEFVLGKDGKPPPKAFMEAMPYTQSLLARGLAIGYHAKAAPPTVTMPRLKAMVSGAIGGFLDVASNFNTQAFLDDNLIAQFLKIGWKMVMLGDETWLKLFPNMFSRHDGVSSFFVKDTIQVDYNVSRHLTNELSSPDWDLLILHYLGLDHVGHIGGRNSILMAPKLMEMDEVIKRIHSSITKTQEIYQGRTLLMIVSDHGMTEAGNHGGSSYEETDSLALFATEQKYIYIVHHDKSWKKQVDIASTLALLFGVPIPKNNVGTVMAEVFASLEEKHKIWILTIDMLMILELNSWQLLRLLQTHLTESGCGRFACESGSGIEDGPEKFCCSYLDAAALHESWKSKKSSRSIHGDDYRSIVLAYHDFLRTTSKWLSSRSTDKPVGLLASGIAAMLLSCLGLMSLVFLFGQEVDFKKSLHLSHKGHLDEIFIVATIFVLILGMGSSSMIEEEQYIWHFMTSSMYLILLRRTIQTITSCSHLAYYIIGILSLHLLSLVLVVIIYCIYVIGWFQNPSWLLHYTFISHVQIMIGKAFIFLFELDYCILFYLLFIVEFMATSIRRSNQLSVSFQVYNCSHFVLPSLFVYQHRRKMGLSPRYLSTIARNFFTILNFHLIFSLLILTISFSSNIHVTSAAHLKFLKFNKSSKMVATLYHAIGVISMLGYSQSLNTHLLIFIYIFLVSNPSYFCGTDNQVTNFIDLLMKLTGTRMRRGTNPLASYIVIDNLISCFSKTSILGGIYDNRKTFVSYIIILINLYSMTFCRLLNNIWWYLAYFVSVEILNHLAAIYCTFLLLNYHNVCKMYVKICVVCENMCMCENVYSVCKMCVVLCENVCSVCEICVVCVKYVKICVVCKILCVKYVKICGV